MSEADYVVIRASADLPPGFMPRHLDGKWFDMATMRSYSGENRVGAAEAVAVPTGRFEVRDDGAVAEIWEIRP